jgi:3-hydroxybutyryl-CoA dehydratase
MAFLSLDDIRAKGSHAERVVFTQDQLSTFITLSRDTAAIHTDLAFATQKGFDGRVVHWFLAALPFSRILGMELPGEHAVIGSLHLDFRAPVYVGDDVLYTVTVTRIMAPLGTVALDLHALKSDRTACIDGKTTCVVKG